MGGISKDGVVVATRKNAERSSQRVPVRQFGRFSALSPNARPLPKRPRPHRGAAELRDLDALDSRVAESE
jgi:hypothetical protein